jgi:hypothetical protein
LSSLKQIRTLIPLGPNGEELHISSNVEESENKFGDPVRCFEVSNNDGSARHWVQITISPLRPRLRAVRATDKPSA